MGSIVINFKKKDLFLVLAIGIFVIGMGFVVAYNSNWVTSPGTPSVMGHTPDEIFKCSANKILKTDASGNWQCADDSAGAVGDLGAYYFNVPEVQNLDVSYGTSNGDVNFNSIHTSKRFFYPTKRYLKMAATCSGEGGSCKFRFGIKLNGEWLSSPETDLSPDVTGYAVLDTQPIPFPQEPTALDFRVEVRADWNRQDYNFYSNEGIRSPPLFWSDTP